MPEVLLSGCTPEPLMSYLKALGALRLVAEQCDPDVRGAWKASGFVLYSNLVESGLLNFFQWKYEPTPILAPWNGGCGFYVKWDPKRGQFKSREAVQAIENLSNSSSPRLAPYRTAIKATKEALARLAKPVDLDAELRGKTKKEIDKTLGMMLLFQLNGQTVNLGKADKDQFLAALRSGVVGDQTLRWLDAALVLLTGQKKNRAEVPTLGSGGNVGNSDFSAMFAQLLGQVLPFREGEDPTLQGENYLRASLLGTPVPDITISSIGQFDPGKAGGANATQGMESAPFLNPWDFVLMLEGTLLLGGAVSRRLGGSRVSGVFPFVVESSGVGYGSAGKDTTRGELWLPVWRRQCTIREVQVLFSEGRAEVGKKRATSGVTFAQAVAGLGVDRGIEEFARFEFQERLGQSYLASSLGRFEVRERRGVDLLQEVNDWLNTYRRACAQEATPPRFSSSLRRIDSAIFDFCHYGGNSRMAGILCALGNAEQELANGEKFRKTDKRTIHPLPPLSGAWLSACDDGTSEFRLARSLAFIFGDKGRKVGNLRANLEAVEWKGNRWAWAEKNRAVVWSGGDLNRNLLAVLMRRLMDAERAGLEKLPLASRFAVALSEMAGFIAGETDDGRLSELLWGLILVKGVEENSEQSGQPRAPAAPPPLPRAYALLKLLFLPGLLSWPTEATGVKVKPEPELLGKLQSGDLPGACEIARRRLRATGFVPLPGPTSGGPRRSMEFVSRDRASTVRLGAALLFPVYETGKLAELILRPKAEKSANATT